MVIGRRNDEHVFAIKFQQLSPSDVQHVCRDQDVSPSGDRRQQDMPIVFDFVEDPFRFVPAARDARRLAAASASCSEANGGYIGNRCMLNYVDHEHVLLVLPKMGPVSQKK